MTKQELLDILNNAIPDAAKFASIKVLMYVSRKDSEVTYRYLHELQTSDIVANGRISVSEDFTTGELTITIERR